VANFRGFSKAELADFAGINVFVGGGGKSALLEALYMALSPLKGLSYVVKRRGWFGFASAESLFYSRGEGATISAAFEGGGGEEVEVKPVLPVAERADDLRAKGLDVRSLYALRISAAGRFNVEATLYLDAEGRDAYVIRDGPAGPICSAAFVDWSGAHEHGRPEEAYAAMVKGGGWEAKEAVVKALQAEVEGLRDITTILSGNKYALHLVFSDRAVPYYVAGDGVRYALLLLMHAHALRGGVLLVEEPELHAHPSLLEVVAGSILGAYRERGNQVFLSTHSLELVEALVEQAEELGLKDQDLKVYRLALKGGAPYSKVYTLSEALDAVKKLEWDLRR